MRRVLTLLTVLVVGLLVIGAVLGVAVWLLQRPLLYLAGGSVPSEPPAGVEAVTLTTDDSLDLGAWWVPADEPCATAIVLPGNAGTRALREPTARMLNDLGVSTLLVDYRGYADNPGTPSESGLRADARAARAWLDERGIDDEKMVYLGESLGAAVAAGLASERPPAALILRSPFPSLAEAAAAAYGLPAVPPLVLRDRYPTADQVAELSDEVAVAVVAGANDRIVPARLSAAVAEAAGVEARTIESVGHNDPLWLDSPEMREVVTTVLGEAGLC